MYYAHETPEETFLRFHRLATNRKIDLAMRGLPVPNFLVDDLYEQAQVQGIGEDCWIDYIYAQLPDPDDPVGAADAADAAVGEASMINSGDGSSSSSSSSRSSGGSAGEGCRALQHFAERLVASQYGANDLDVGRLLDAVKAFVISLEELGGFMALSMREVAVNVSKVEAALGCTSECAYDRSLRALLESEILCGLHSSGRGLADPSAAMGVLWVGRVLRFWEEVCLLRTAPAAAGENSQAPLVQVLDTAYQSTLIQYHGWVTQQAFSLTIQAAPEWSSIEGKLAPDNDTFRADVAEWVSASPVKRINTILTELDLVHDQKTS